jgi:hypothetical protein
MRLAGHPFVEYGIVEHRLRTRFPDLFAAHVAEQGHSGLTHAPAHANCAIHRRRRSAVQSACWSKVNSASTLPVA